MFIIIEHDVTSLLSKDLLSSLKNILIQRIHVTSSKSSYSHGNKQEIQFPKRKKGKYKIKIGSFSSPQVRYGVHGRF